MSESGAGSSPEDLQTEDLQTETRRQLTGRSADGNPPTADRKICRRKPADLRRGDPCREKKRVYERKRAAAVHESAWICRFLSPGSVLSYPKKETSKDSRKTAETSQKGTVKGIKPLRFAEALDFARHGIRKINNFATYFIFEMVKKEEKSSKKDITVNSKELAEYLGLTPRRVQQLVSDGTLKPKSAKPYRFDLKKTVSGYVQFLSDKVQGREEKEAPVENDLKRKLKADADLKGYKAQMAKLELEELEGKMHRSEDVQDMTNDLIYTVRHAIIALPGRLAMDVSKIMDASEASIRIRSECYEVLKELSEYKYDPEAYKKKVRDRSGWDAVMNDDEEDENGQTEQG